jgi:hypothetical protein
MLRTVKHAVSNVLVIGVAVVATTFGGGLPARADDSDLYGCPSGAVCIYADNDDHHLNGDYITNIYWSYGAHNLVNQYDTHWVINNQYGGPNATAQFCEGYNGGGDCTHTIWPHTGALFYLTPINSIVLNRP